MPAGGLDGFYEVVHAEAAEVAGGEVLGGVEGGGGRGLLLGFGWGLWVGVYSGLFLHRLGVCVLILYV